MSSRLGPGPTLLGIARKNLEDAHEVWALELEPLEQERDDHCLIAIVFAALAFEASIYDFAARNLGDRYVSDHLDRLDPLSKLVVATRLVTTEDFPKGGKAFQLLKQLVMNRNYIVHSKSAPFHWTGSLDHLGGAAKRRLEFGKDLLERAQGAVQALDELSEVMLELEPSLLKSASFLRLTEEHGGESGDAWEGGTEGNLHP
jgi:hypothetical protein